MAKTGLSKLQKDILSFFGKDSFAVNFYWTGGTLLSYFYFSHRMSVDLDFFSDDLFSDDQYLNFMNRLKKEINAQKVTQILQQNRRIYNIERKKETVKIELVFFPFPAAGKREELKEFNVKADSLIDIMANKTLSTYQRNEPKDVYDLYCYLEKKSEYNLTGLIGLVEKKFGVAIEPMLLLVKINELADNLKNIKPLLISPKKNITAKIKFFFQKEFNNLAKKKIKQ